MEGQCQSVSARVPLCLRELCGENLTGSVSSWLAGVIAIGALEVGAG